MTWFSSGVWSLAVPPHSLSAALCNREQQVMCSKHLELALSCACSDWVTAPWWWQWWPVWSFGWTGDLCCGHQSCTNSCVYSAAHRHHLRHFIWQWTGQSAKFDNNREVLHWVHWVIAKKVKIFDCLALFREVDVSPVTTMATKCLMTDLSTKWFQIFIQYTPSYLINNNKWINCSPVKVIKFRFKI